jgi:hypothetical protein
MLGCQPPLQQGRPVHRRVLSPCPRDGFIPRCLQGPLQRPHGCLAPARHDTTPPVLYAPRGAPVGPSAHPRGGAASRLPRLSAPGCLPSGACAGPLRPSADGCRSVRTAPAARRPASGDARPISQGTTPTGPRVDAGWITHTPGGGRTSPSRARSSRVVPPRVSGACASPCACGWGGLPPPPRGGRPCPAPRRRRRDHLARGLAPRSRCATPCTHGQIQRRGACLPRPLQCWVRFLGRLSAPRR